MADLPHATRITMLSREDENVHHCGGIIDRLCTSFRFGSLEENQFRCLIFILSLQSPCQAGIRLKFLSLLDKEPDVKKFRRGPESAGGLHPTNIRSSHSQDANFAENVVITETALSGLLRCCQNCNDNGYVKGFYRESSTKSSMRQNSNNKRGLTQTRQSYDRHWLRYLCCAIRDYIPGENDLQGVLRH
ncbi:unnamed protein product [Hymenolepis diminuta]|uniref:Uncharacterized protein n=1 Tax=Hymenolepis diminuta TaxID=6216 RepID=A0A0R3SRY3_HYMDI|nr:unnamed protein product [Hymenolepis diminuta]